MSTHDSAAPARAVPSSVSTATSLLCAKALLALAGIAVGVASGDEVSAAVAEDPATAGMAGLVTSIGVAVGVVGGLVAAGLWVLCAVFVRKGAGWARILATVLAGLSILSGLLGVLGLVVAAAVPETGVPTSTLTVVLTVLGVVVSAAVVVALFHPASNAFFRAAAAARAAVRA